ncbi:MAG: hypothetical protein BZY80_00265 [SAR202 cluster bacterium Io17-Chloro-G2]|nr:MAG: hypothetical protein BZY80_00265 [SAR202 cluster bacterium Io17-Chloro-G2]
MTDYYNVLGLPRTADDKAVRQAYRKLARQYHPDVNHEDSASEEKFKAINEAYSVLSDPDKRRRYNRYGDDWEHSDRIEEAQARSRRGGGFGFREGSESFSGQSSIFDRLFSDFGGGRSRAPSPPPATEHPVEITLEEAFQGASRLLSLANGRRLEVKIPAGVDNGSRVHIPAGGTGQGDLYLVMAVKDHPRFERKGNDLYSQVEVPLSDAILGGDVNVPTMKGQVSLTIPPETQNGRRFRLAGRGMPVLNDPTSQGNLYATVKVVLPAGLSPEEQELFQQLRRLRQPEGQMEDSDGE